MSTNLILYLAFMGGKKTNKRMTGMTGTAPPSPLTATSIASRSVFVGDPGGEANSFCTCQQWTQVKLQDGSNLLLLVFSRLLYLHFFSDKDNIHRKAVSMVSGEWITLSRSVTLRPRETAAESKLPLLMLTKPSIDSFPRGTLQCITHKHGEKEN